ncbi:MAG: tyrosine-protein phosphatase [Myxococcota bacterium]
MTHTIRTARLLRAAGLLGIAVCIGGLGACQSLAPPEERAVPALTETEVRDRHLPLDGAANARDLGGYTTRDGRQLRWGVLYRSDTLGELSDDDLLYLERLGVRRIVDFRSELERDREPDRVPGGAAVTWQPISGDGLDPRELQDQLMSGEITEEEASGWLIEGNRAFVTEFAPVYARFLRELAEPDATPTLFHCTAGKDRAGFAAALVLMALDVPRDAIMQDYLLTNDYLEPKTQRMLRLIRWASLFRADPVAVRPLFEARPSYLQAAFDTIDAEYGGVDRYLREGLGVDDAMLARLQANLLD